MCSIDERELVAIERMIFKFLWNKKWVGNMAPDRIKRDILKQTHAEGGLMVPDVKILDKALKVRQFIRSMITTHPVSLAQKFHLENIGYFEYFKCEYAKLCERDSIVRSYQEICNSYTDRMRALCNESPVPDPDTIKNCINIVASTDILELLKRKNYPLIINLFSRLSNLGITTYFQLLNEANYPRSDEIGVLAKNILNIFPHTWQTLVLSRNDINQDITFENEFPVTKLNMCNPKKVTVKIIRSTILESVKLAPKAFLNNQKFELGLVPNHNPFTLLRKAIHPPRDRFFKYRILQGDIFTKERLFRFKLAINPFCEYCQNNTIETVKHLLWDCPRSQFVWVSLNSIINRAYNYNYDYINYNCVLVGSANPIMLLERFILIGLKLVLKIDRADDISIETIISKIKLQFILEKHKMRSNPQVFHKTWEEITKIIPIRAI